jgi:predicted aspartyl protease
MINDPGLSSRTLQVAAIVFAVATGIGLPEAEGAGCKLAMLSEWPVRIENNQLLVEGAVNGQPVRVMLDTGSPRTLLDRATATRLNATRRDVAQRDRVLAAGTESKLEIAFLDEFQVVDFKRAPWRIVISRDRDLAADVLLGEDFLSLVDFEFDLEHNAVRLFQPENCEGKKLAYWASDTQSVGDVPIDRIIATHPQIVLDVAINGKTISALLDSGAASSVLDKPAASRLGATPETPGVTVVGQRSSVAGKTLPLWSAPFQSFAIGTETAKDVHLPFSELFRDAHYSSLGSHIPTKVEGSQQMLLGVDFLRSHRVLVSHSQKRMYFTHNGGPVFASSRLADAKGDASQGADGKPAAPAN